MNKSLYIPFIIQDSLDIPNGDEMFAAIKVMKILTLVLTNSLGNYEWTYLKQMDDEGRTFVHKKVYIRFSNIHSKM